MELKAELRMEYDPDAGITEMEIVLPIGEFDKPRFQVLHFIVDEQAELYGEMLRFWERADSERRAENAVINAEIDSAGGNK